MPIHRLRRILRAASLVSAIQYLRTETMLRRQFIRLLSGKAAVALAFSLAGCTYYGDDPPRRIFPYPDPNYEYYYYSDINVYFHIHTGFYYHYHGGVWHRSRRLPRHLHLKRRHRRRLYIREPSPYDRNREHRRRYQRPRDGPGDGRGARRDGETHGERVPEHRPRRRLPDDRRGEERLPRTRVEPRRDQDGPRHPAPDVEPRVRRRSERRERVREGESAERLRRWDREERETIEGVRRRRRRWLEQD